MIATPERHRAVFQIGPAGRIPAVLLALGLATSGAHALTRPQLAGPPVAMPVAVFGTDDRVVLPKSRADLAAKFGLLVDTRTHSVCTAFCVDERVVATAAHCLFKTVGETAPRLPDFRFRRKLDQTRGETRIAGSGTGAELQNVSQGSSRLSVKPPINATDDWALVRLEQPACKAGGILPISRRTPSEVMALAAERRVYQVAYHRDVLDWRLAYGPACAVRRDFDNADWPTIARDFSDPDNLLLHGCDTGGASSGSPLLVDGPHGPEVVGLNVGTYVQSKVMMQDGEVVERLGADTVANTGLSTLPMAERLAEFRRAEILDTEREIASLRKALARLGIDTGGEGGRYDARLGHAIRTYQSSRGLPASGIASRELLRRVVAEAHADGIVTGAIGRAP